MTWNAAVCGGQIFGVKRRFLLISSGREGRIREGADSLIVTESSQFFPVKLSGPFRARVAHT